MNEVQREYHKQLNRILRLKVPKQIKRQMLYGFQQVLRQHYQIQAIVFNQSFNEISMVKSSQKPLEIESTKFTESISIDNVTIISQRDIQELQEHILSKKILKIQNYELIETFQEQLYAIEDTVQCKRKYNQHLRRQIDKKMIDIQEQKERSMQLNDRSASLDNAKSKRNKSFSDYLKSWWH